jgi:hypothetical protein
MDEVLAEAEAFAAAQPYMEGFAESFRQARAALGGAPDKAAYFALAPRGFLTAEADALLAAGQHAWVFGGMGSWNDNGFEDKQVNAHYEQLSDRLFDVLNEGLAAAANSSAKAVAPSAPGPKKWWRPW